MRKIDLPKCPLIDFPMAKIKPYVSNPWVHPKRQIQMLEASYARFGVMTPIMVTSDGELIAGHLRHVVATRVGLNSIPAIVIPHLNETERQALRIADNAISQKGKWSIELLADQIEIIMSAELKIDPVSIGFETGEIDAITLTGSRAPQLAAAAQEPDRTRPAVSRIGDLFRIEQHTIVCGDAKDWVTFEAALGSRKAAAVISDQPWNLPARFISGKGRVRHPDFVEGFGEMSAEEFSSFTELVLTNQARCCQPGALVFQFIDWRSVDVMIAAGKQFVGDLVALCVWVKQAKGMGSPWRSQHELICVFRVGKGKSKNNVKLGAYGRNRSNVWSYDAPTGFGAERAKLKLHPTCKNEAMIADAILDCTDRGDLILDAFLGSGTTALAAHRTKRIAVGIELDCHYVDLAVKRLSEATGEAPIHQSGKTFNQIRDERGFQGQPDHAGR